MQALMPRIGLCYTNGRNYDHGAGAHRDACCLSPYLRHSQVLEHDLVAAAISASMDDLRYVSAHRWRYARVANPLGQRFLRSANATLYIGGGWCLGARADAACASGDAIANDILEIGDVG